jgi:hypothetical protein
LPSDCWLSDSIVEGFSRKRREFGVEEGTRTTRITELVDFAEIIFIDAAFESAEQ